MPPRDEITVQYQRARRGRPSLPKDLPRERVEYDLTPAEKGEFERLERQMGVAAPIADKLIIYQYQGLMNKRSSLVNIGAPGTDELHAAYAAHRAKHL
jgi:hypothetical protein